MCNNRKIGGKPAAPAPNENPAPAAPFPASEVDEREGQAENVVFLQELTLTEETISSVFVRLSEYAVALVTGNIDQNPDYDAAREICEDLTELENACKKSPKPRKAKLAESAA